VCDDEDDDAGDQRRRRGNGTGAWWSAADVARVLGAAERARRHGGRCAAVLAER